MILDTGTTGIFVIVTNAVAKIFEPSVLDTIMVAEPAEMPVMRPLFTVATDGLLDDHTIT
jgi:hypothetical protein